MKAPGLSLQWFLDEMDASRRIGFTRYGDGEWRTILGGLYTNQTNSNGCTFSPNLRGHLRRVLRANKPYIHSVLRIAKRSHEEEIDEFIAKKQIKVKWRLGDVLLNKALSGELFPFIERLRDRRILVVGPEFLRQLGPQDFFRPITFYHPPRQNAIEQIAHIVPLVIHLCETYRIDTVLWSSGLHTKVFVDDLWEETEGVDHIDCGSMWDGFCGQKSRSYMRRNRVLWDDLIEVNTGQRKKRKGETFRK